MFCSEILCFEKSPAMLDYSALALGQEGSDPGGALKFERLASHEKNPDVKAQLEKQAAAYRRLAEKRADE